MNHVEKKRAVRKRRREDRDAVSSELVPNMRPPSRPHRIPKPYVIEVQMRFWKPHEWWRWGSYATLKQAEQAFAALSKREGWCGKVRRAYPEGFDTRIHLVK